MKIRPSVLAFKKWLSEYDLDNVPYESDPDSEQTLKPFFELVRPGSILHIIQGVNVFFNKESSGFRHVHEILLYHDNHHDKPVWLGMSYDDERKIKGSQQLIQQSADTPRKILGLIDNVIGRALSKSRDYHWLAEKGDINPVITLMETNPDTFTQTRLDKKTFFQIPLIQKHIAREKPLLLLGMSAYMNSKIGIERALSIGIEDPNAPLVLPSGSAIGIAAHQGNLEAIDTLLCHPKIHPNGEKRLSGSRVSSALMRAIEGNQHVAFDRILASPKTDPNVDGLLMRTLLISAMHTEYTNPYIQPGFAEKLIADPRTDVNMPDALYEIPPVIYALKHDNRKIIEALVRHPDLDLPLSMDQKYPEYGNALERYRALREQPGFTRKLANK